MRSASASPTSSTTATATCKSLGCSAQLRCSGMLTHETEETRTRYREERFKIMKTGENRRRDLEALEKRRRAGMALLAKGVFQAEVARIVGVSRMTVLRWERLRTEKTRGAWKCRRLGRPPKSTRKHPRWFSPAVKRGFPARVLFNDSERLLRVVKVVKRESGMLIPPAQLLRFFKEHGKQWLSEKVVRKGDAVLIR